MKRYLVPLVLFSAFALSSVAGDLVEVSSPRSIPKTFSPNSKVRVINVWATWCSPCVTEMPDLQQIRNRFRPEELDLIGISMDDMIPGDRETLKRKVSGFLRSKSITFPNLYYTGRPNDLADYFDFGGELPVSIVLDSKGREVFRVEGAINKADFEKQLRESIRALTTPTGGKARVPK